MPNLTRRELTLRISNETGIVQRKVQSVIDLTLDYLTESLSKGQTVEIRNFGIFKVKITKSRVGRNPRRPEYDIVIPARGVVRFKAGKNLTSKVRKLAHGKISSTRYANASRPSEIKL